MTEKNLAEMLTDEAEGMGQYLTEDPVRLQVFLAGVAPDELLREFSGAMGKVSAGLALAHLSHGQTRVALEVMGLAMMLAHMAITHAKEGGE